MWLYNRTLLLRLKVKKRIKTRKNNPCRGTSCQRPTSGPEVRPHVKYIHSSRWLPPTSEQSGLVCTWLVQKVPFALYALPPGTTWGCTTAGTTGGGHVTDTGSAEAGATTGGRSCSGAGAVDWWYIDKPVRGTRSMIVLDGSPKQKFYYRRIVSFPQQKNPWNAL